MRAFTPAFLVALTLLVGAPSVSSASSADVDRMLGLLPADALGVAVVDLQQLRQAPAYQHMHGILSQSDAYRGALGTAGAGGIDEDAVHRVAMATLSTSTSSPRVLSIIQGSFSADDARTAAGAQAGAASAEAGTGNLFTHQQGALLVLEDGLIAVGTTAEIQALAARGAGEASRFGSTLRAQVAAANRSAPLWFAGIVNDQMRGMDERLANLEGFSGHISMRDGLQMDLRVAGANPEVAERLVQDFQTQQETLRNGPSADVLAGLGVTAILDGLSITSDGNAATVALRLDNQRWMALVATLGAMIESELR